MLILTTAVSQERSITVIFQVMMLGLETKEKIYFVVRNQPWNKWTIAIGIFKEWQL